METPYLQLLSGTQQVATTMVALLAVREKSRLTRLSWLMQRRGF